MADAVDAAVRTLRELEEQVRSGQTLAQDVILNTAIGLDNLRTGAGMVHGSVTELETRVRDEVLRIMGDINIANNRINTGESAMQQIGNAMSAVDGRVRQ